MSLATRTTPAVVVTCRYVTASSLDDEDLVLTPIMAAFGLLAGLLVCATSASAHKPIYVQPEQIHIAYGDEPTSEMTVTWATKDLPPSAEVYYGLVVPDSGVKGVTEYFEDGGKQRRAQYIHRVRLRGLRPATTYLYRCGSELGWSNEYSFRTANASDLWELRVAAYGDMGNLNAKSLPSLQRGAQAGTFHAVLHIGDFAYDMDSDNGRVGDEFLRQIQPIAAYVPYMVCPGNHEKAYNFSHYRSRFSMPGKTENLFYSYNLGPVHFISINTEAYYYLQYGVKILINQYNWLVKDLKEANLEENRSKRPWIVTYGHKPMYCSNWDPQDCSHNTTRVRVGLPGFEHWFGLEKLFYDEGVDLELWGHEHSYERLWPIYDYTVRNGSVESPYTNPRAPVHITSGSAGCDEYIANFTKLVHPWSAFRNMDYGYLNLHFVNKSHLHLEQLSAEKNEIIDEIWIVKESHKSYS